jgi:predicted metal-dependent hydrolase
MIARKPDIRPDAGPLIWSRIPEFAITFNSYSVVIPYVEYYLNGVMGEVMANHCHDDPELREQLGIFIKQETYHSQFHHRFNKRMFDAGIGGLRELVETVQSELATLRQRRSLAFNAAYCAGFESIATYDARYLYEECDALFDGADPHGANLLLWHVAEEFEHRAICHEAFNAVSGNYFIRLCGLGYAFWHIGGTFLKAERLVHDHFLSGMSEAERRQSRRRAKRIFWRQMRYLAPRMLKILVPGYNPARLDTPDRIAAGLAFYRTTGPIAHHPLSAA